MSKKKTSAPSFEAGQLLHNNPVGAPLPDYAEALLVSIREEIGRVYWNVNQKSWGFAAHADDEAWYWDSPDLPEDGTGIPGVAWRAYYNWGGSPEDADWDQAKANLPNFSFDGVEIRWYKRFGRSMNANVQWGPAEWVAWFERCIDAIRVFENRRDCWPREEAIDNGGAARRCPKCDRHYVQSHKGGRCGWDGTPLVGVRLTKADRASIKRKQDEWRKNRKHGTPERYDEIVESVPLARGWKAVLARGNSMMWEMLGRGAPPWRESSALLLYPCGCVHSSFTAGEDECRREMKRYEETWKGCGGEMKKAEARHADGPF